MPKRIKKSRVTNVSCGVTYNLGNYQNVRYDLGAEVPPGGSARQTLVDLKAILLALKPFPSDYETQRALEVIRKSDEQLTEHEKAHLEEFKEKAATYAALQSRRDWALGKLDAIGGSGTYTDAKKNWCDQEGDELF